VLKQADAQKIKAESAHSGSAGHSKIKLNESVKELSLYGDLRLRWQHGQAVNQAVGAGGNSNQDQATRFRLLIGGNFKLTDGLSAGVELSTQSAPNQRYVTAGQAGSDYTLGLSKAFIGWNPSKEFSVTAGRQSIPFYSTEMVWDNDVRLDGVTEKIDLGALLGLGNGLHLHFISGQFIGGNNLSLNAPAAVSSADSWLIQSQLKAVADLGGAKLTFAPGFQWSNSETAGNGTGGVNANALSNLSVILAPGDISFDLAGTKAKFLWDFAYNFGPDSRLGADISATQDKMAWLLGIQIGENKNKGDFSVFGNYREIGAGALNTYYSDSEQPSHLVLGSADVCSQSGIRTEIVSEIPEELCLCASQIEGDIPGSQNDAQVRERIRIHPPSAIPSGFRVAPLKAWREGELSAA